jgi:CMP-N-acetylneuraminic acid synthetase
MNYLAVIPARGDSKGIPRKNVVMLAGKPLIVHTCSAAKGSKKISSTMVSTDDNEIADVSKKAGVDVPFLRPKELAGDATPMIDVLQQIISQVKDKPDAIVLLQPTSPLRTSKHIDEAIAQFESSNADTLVSVMDVPHQYAPKKLMREENGFLSPVSSESQPRRQEMERLYARNGPAILIVKRELIEAGTLYGKNIAGYVMSREDSVDIDEQADLLYAEFLLSLRK